MKVGADLRDESCSLEESFAEANLKSDAGGESKRRRMQRGRIKEANLKCRRQRIFFLELAFCVVFQGVRSQSRSRVKVRNLRGLFDVVRHDCVGLDFRGLNL